MNRTLEVFDRFIGSVTMVAAVVLLVWSFETPGSPWPYKAQLLSIWCSAWAFVEGFRGIL